MMKHVMRFALAWLVLMPGLSIQPTISSASNSLVPTAKVIMDDFHEGLAAVRIGWQYGYLDQKGNWAIRPQYSFAASFSDGMARVTLDEDNRDVFYIDRTGIRRIQSGFEDTKDFHEGLAAVKINGKWGYIGKDGKYAIPAKYESATDFTEGFGIVRWNATYRYVDKKGHLLAGSYSGALPFSEGMAAVKQSGKWGYINKSGRWAIKPQFTDADVFSEGLAWVAKGKIRTAINAKGQKMFAAQADWKYTDEFHDGLSRFSKDSGKNRVSGFINKTGKVVISAKYVSAENFSGGRSLAIRKYSGTGIDYYGYIDKKGIFTIAQNYLEAGNFSEGLAYFWSLKDEEQYGYMDADGKVSFVIQPETSDSP